MQTVEYYIVASRGRNPENPSDRRKGIFLVQRYEINKQKICNCLTRVSKDNLVLEIHKRNITNLCYLTPNNFSHKAGDGISTRKRNIRYIHPALQANCGATQCTYLLVRIDYGNGKD